MDISVSPPSYGVAFLPGGDGIRETEAPRLRARTPNEPPPQAVLPQPLGSAALAWPAPEAEPAVHTNGAASHAACGDDEGYGFGDFCEAPGSMEEQQSGAQLRDRGPALQHGHQPDGVAWAADDFGDFAEAAPAPAAAPEQQPVAQSGPSTSSSASGAGLANGHASSASQSWSEPAHHSASSAIPAYTRVDGGSSNSGAIAAPAQIAAAATSHSADWRSDSVSFAPAWGKHHGSMPAIPDPAAGIFAPESWQTSGAAAAGTPVKAPRVTPTSVFSMGHSDDDSEFGDFEAAHVATAAVMDRFGT